MSGCPVVPNIGGGDGRVPSGAQQWGSQSPSADYWGFGAHYWGFGAHYWGFCCLVPIIGVSVPIIGVSVPIIGVSVPIIGVSVPGAPRAVSHPPHSSDPRLPLTRYRLALICSTWKRLAQLH